MPPPPLTPLFIKGLGFLKIRQIFKIKVFCKNGRRGCLKHCFSLIMRGFCGSNALYSASIAYKTAVYKKACNTAFQSSKNEEFIVVFIWYFTGVILSENSGQKGMGNSHIGKGLNLHTMYIVHTRSIFQESLVMVFTSERL